MTDETQNVCKIITNNQIEINESHNNNFMFILQRVPSSYLLSQFLQTSAMDGSLESIVDGGLEFTRESNQDVANFALYLSSVTMPDLDLDTTAISTSFADLNRVTGKIKFGTLTTNIMNDANWFIYRMLLYWMYAASNPEEFNKLEGFKYISNFYTVGHLILLDNHREKVLEFEFRDLHPQNIGQQEFNYQDAAKIIFPVTWIYSTMVPSDYYVIKKV